MDLLSLTTVLVVLGVILWLINTHIPMDEKIKTILNWAVVIIVILWLLKSLGFLSKLSSISI